MAVYPAYPAPKHGGYSITPIWKTTITPYDGQNEQRNKKRLYPFYDVNLQYNPLTQAKFEYLWDFYMARCGAYEAFWFYTPEIVTFTANALQYVGCGDAATATFDLPGKSTSGQIIYIDNQLQSGNYSILTGSGDGSSDQVQFVADPADGTIISAGFSGYFRARVRFSEDKLTKQQFEMLLYTTGIDLKGLNPAISS